MVCWRCKYFKTPSIEKPSAECKDKSNFKLWFKEEE